MTEFNFQKGIVENAMDYSYFSFTRERLKAKGLKIVVAFVHSSFQLEVWISGYNRKTQCKLVEQLAPNCPFELSPEPSRTDYIIRVPIETKLSDGEHAVDEVKRTAIQCISFLETCL